MEVNIRREPIAHFVTLAALVALNPAAGQPKSTKVATRTATKWTLDTSQLHFT